MEKFEIDKSAYHMKKKTLRDTGAIGKKETDYFQITRTSDPIESYGIREFRKRAEVQRKKKAEKQKNRR